MSLKEAVLVQRGALIAGAAWAALASVAQAQEVLPENGGVGLLPPATEIMREIESFHSFLLPIIVAISALVLVLLLWVIVRYNRRANPTPKKFTHNMTVEVIWTIVPVLILVAIAWKSFPLIYKEERIPPNAELTLKVTGNSWFWSFEYPDLGVQVVQNMLAEEDAAAQGRPYLLAVDNALFVPVDTTVRVLVTSNDVIHSFAVPSFGVKEDAIQGRVNDTWFRVDRPGVYYGQCSELCGINHAYMPLEIHAVSREEFNAWVTANGGSLASAEPAPALEEPAPAQASPAAQPTR
ncbi:MAG: cytochrome c oxidase subunit II [Hyphomonadaceae bacterium]|nr:cytochrome c oxidase subunit II [Hyphomonadaceae bacterium]